MNFVISAILVVLFIATVAWYSSEYQKIRKEEMGFEQKKEEKEDE